MISQQKIISVHDSSNAYYQLNLYTVYISVTVATLAYSNRLNDDEHL
jgi:hypothetical protein